MKRISAYLSLAAFGLLLLSSCQNKSANDAPALQMGDDIAIAQTQYGKVQGYIMNNVYTFLGIPYGAPTSGENRFMAPKAPEPWSDVRGAFFYGDSAPQNTKGKYTNTYYTMRDHWNYYDVSENCLMLNVWTNGLDAGKRPVMVWFHGGGWSAGNGIEQDGYDGENFAAQGDVVFVSVNHRLGSFGFSDFSGVDPKYADSGNVGALDMVAALKWVNQNIANFGGDPSNVTIMGQSGGGAKVCTLAAMPEAKGLVHKVVALSGSSVSGQKQETSQALGKYIVEQSGKTVEELQAMPMEEYLALSAQLSSQFSKEHPEYGRGGFSPVADGKHLPKGGFFDDPNASSADIPIIFCTTMAEGGVTRTITTLENQDLSSLVSFIQGRYPNKNAQAIAEAYQKAFPDYLMGDLAEMISSPRTGAINAANAKSAQKAPVYLAWFGYTAPMYGGRTRAFHCMDISFWFLNTDKMVSHTGGGAKARALSQKMADALLAFMRTGDPNVKGLPTWPAYNKEDGATMILRGDKCEVRNDPDRDARAVLAQ